MFRTKIMVLIVVGVVILSLVIAGCGTPAPSPTPSVSPIKVGVTGPLSGANASWGLTFKRCTEMWAEEVNADGGLLVDGVKHPIEVYIEDTRFEADKAKTAAERLAYEYKVGYVMGPATTLEFKIQEPIFESSKIVAFAGSFTNSLFGPDHPYSIMAVPPAFAFAPVVFEYLIETADIKSVYCLGPNDPTGLVVADQSATAAKNLGLEVLAGAATYEPDITDFYPVITKIVSANPDVLAIGCGAEDQARIAKACGELGFKGQLVAMLSGDTETIVSVAGEYAEGVMWMGGKPTTTPKFDKFQEDYTAKYGTWNDEAILKIVDAWMIGATIQAAGEAALTDNDAWVEAMPKVAWPNPYLEGNPTIKYAGGWILGKDCLVGLPVCITQIQNGKAVTIKCALPK